MTSSIEGKIAPFGDAVDALGEFMAGGANEDVQTAGGSMPTLRKLIANITDAADQKVTEEIGDLSTARQEVEDTAQQVEQTRSDVNTLALGVAADRANAQTAAANAQAAAGYKTNRPSVRWATTGALPTNTYDNAAGTITCDAVGVLPTIDGGVAAVGDDILVKDEPVQTKNGIYRLTTAGTASVKAVFTRRATENTSATLGSACVQVTSGTLNAGWTFLCQQAAPTLGTTAVSFVGQSAAVGAEAQARLVADNALMSAQNYVMQALPTAMGTIGTLQATVSQLTWEKEMLVRQVGALWAEMELSPRLSKTPDFYISTVHPAASDNNSGTHPDAPWATMAPYFVMAGVPNRTTVKIVTAQLDSAVVSPVQLPSCTYTNGAAGVGAKLTMDTPGVLAFHGLNMAVGDPVLVMGQADAKRNGPYTCTRAGTVSVAAELTRRAPEDTAAGLEAGIWRTSTVAGSTLSNVGFRCTQKAGEITVGVSPVNIVLASVSDKVLAFERRGSYAPMDLGLVNADRATVVAYGVGDRPFFDLTDAIPAAWTLYSAGVYSITLNRLADSKCFTNIFRNKGAPLRKVESIAALAGKGDFVCYIAGETTGALTVYMNAPADPNTDGAAYRFTRYAIALNFNGTGNIVDSVYTYGTGAQDGAIKLGGGSGGNVISRCRLDWGARHSAYIGSGSIPSYTRFCEYYGAANEIETNSVLNAAGTANAVVFNSNDHTTALCVSQFNLYNGMGRRNYISGTRVNFTGPYGHDAVQGRPMLRFEAVGDVYIDMQQGPGICGQTNLFSGLSFKNCIDMLAITTTNATSEVTGTLSGSETDRLLNNSSYTTTINYRANGLMVIPDAGAGGAGWLRAGEGTAISYVTFADSSFLLKGCQHANANKRFLRVRQGSLKMTGCTVGPNLAPPVDLLIEAGIGGQTCTLELSGNKWPYGSNFQHAGQIYRGLDAWMAAGKETGSSYNALPWAQITDGFNGADANLGDTPGWARLNGSAGDLQRRSSVLYCATSAGPTVYTRGDVDSADMYVSYVVKGIPAGGGGGPALRLVDTANLLYARVTSGNYGLMRFTGGAVSALTSTANANPAIGQRVTWVVRDITDPSTGVTSQRTCCIVDGGLYTACMVDASGATGLTGEKTVGAVARGAIGDVADDLMFGAAPIALQ